MWIPGHYYFIDSAQADEFAKEESEEVVTQPDQTIGLAHGEERVILKWSNEEQ